MLHSPTPAPTRGADSCSAGIATDTSLAEAFAGFHIWRTQESETWLLLVPIVEDVHSLSVSMLKNTLVSLIGLLVKSGISFPTIQITLLIILCLSLYLKARYELQLYVRDVSSKALKTPEGYTDSQRNKTQNCTSSPLESKPVSYMSCLILISLHRGH